MSTGKHFSITNQFFPVITAPDNNNPSVQDDLLPIAVVSGGVSPAWEFHKLPNGAYHIKLPTQGPGLVVSLNDQLYLHAGLNSHATATREWEILPSARQPTSPDTNNLNGWYMISVKGDPMCVWMLPDGNEDTQIKVTNLFSADGPSPERTSASTSTDIAQSIGWKARKWLWHISESKLVF